MEREWNGCKVSLVQGDITKLAVEGIVNAANSALAGGGGGDGAIHRAGGAGVLEECRAIIGRIRELPTGDAVATTAGNLPARRVIHTAGPIYHQAGQAAPRLLASAHRRR